MYVYACILYIHKFPLARASRLRNSDCLAGQCQYLQGMHGVIELICVYIYIYIYIYMITRRDTNTHVAPHCIMLDH